MTLGELRAITAELPGTEEDVKWGSDLCFCVGGKMYLVCGWDEAGEVTGLSFKVAPVLFDALTALEGVTPAAYLGRYHWVAAKDGAPFGGALAELVRGSWELVVAKLPRRVQRTLRGGGGAP